MQKTMLEAELVLLGLARRLELLLKCGNGILSHTQRRPHGSLRARANADATQEQLRNFNSTVICRAAFA
jgi:hypothetical protein